MQRREEEVGVRSSIGLIARLAATKLCSMHHQPTNLPTVGASSKLHNIHLPPCQPPIPPPPPQILKENLRHWGHI